MAATGRSSRSVLRPLSSSQRLHNHHHHHHHHRQRSPSPCNLTLRFRFSPGNIPKPSVTVNSNQKRKCLCSPTTHPGSFRCAFHRRLEHERTKTLGSSPKRDNSGNTTRSGGLYLRKLALINSLAKIGTVEAERFRTSLAATIVKPSSLHIRRHPESRPRPSRFYALHQDQDLTS